MTDKIRICLLVFAAAAMAGISHPVKAELDISDTPLFVAVSIDPNIMFILDDSGSMMFETTPDQMAQPSGQTPYGGFVFPRANNVYGDSDYVWGTLSVVTVDHGSAFNAMNRSPQFNATYYNPGVTYLPWTRADGTLFPNASPQCALHNPMREGTGDQYCRNLTENNSRYLYDTRWVECSRNFFGSISCSSSTGNKTFWPATYFWHTDAAADEDSTWEDRDWNWNNYTRVRIRPQDAPFSGHGREARTDCSGSSCSYQQEVQNFANWYTYYRSRILATRAGVGQAFADQSSRMRVGFGAINKGSTRVDGANNTGTIISGVRPFQGQDRTNFYERLYSHAIPSAGTPLRKALDDAGQYYSRTDVRGPWSTTPGQTGGAMLSCRQSYTILMTDGYWVGGSDTAANTSGARANVDNQNGPTISGPDGQSYQYTPSAPYQDNQGNTLADVAMYYWNRDLYPGLDNRVPTTAENPAFWQHMVTFGVSLGVSGSIDPEEAWASVESGETISWPGVDASSSGNCSGAVCSARLDDLLHAAINSRGGFFSAMDPQQFAKDLSAILNEVVARSSSTTSVAVSATRLTTDSLVYAAQFDSEEWTGELAALDATDGSIEYLATERLAAKGHAARNIYTYNPAGNGGGLSFDTSAAAAIGSRILAHAPGGGDPWTAENVINYIRGDATLEGGGGDAYRPRDVMLGDIVSSEPAYSGSGNEGWARIDVDYLDYIDGHKNDPRNCDEVEGACSYARKDTVFIGANDGMLHAFDARTLEEFFAYVPAAVHDKLYHLAEQDYGHKFYVDGQVAIADAKVGGSWGTYLIGTLGAGGRGIFALDVTNPESFGADNVLWELTSEDHPELGYTFGEPIISRLQNGTWVAVFGNGYNSDNGQAHLFVVRLSDGHILHKVQLSSANNNGLSGVVGWRDPGTGTYLERVYAGDLKGTMWRVDFNNSQPSKAFESGLFTDPDGRPITATPNIAAHPSGGLMVYFGTGKLIENSDRLETGLERFYAIRDRNNSISNNNLGNTLGRVTIANVATEPGQPPMRSLTSGEPKGHGWYVDLRVGNDVGERTLAKPRIVFGTAIIATYQPVEDPCTPGGVQRTYVMDALSGDGSLPFCPNCGGIEVGSGAPFSPPLMIKPRPPGSVGSVTYPGHDDPEEPGEPGDFPDPPASNTGAREGWCSEFGIPPLFEGGAFLPLGTICEGRQVWREML